MIRKLYRKLRNLDELEKLRKENAVILEIRELALRHMHVPFNFFPQNTSELELAHKSAVQKEQIFGKIYHLIFQRDVLLEASDNEREEG